MAISEVATAALSGLFGTGLGAALQAVFTSRANSKKITSESEKLDAEADTLRITTDIERENAGIVGSEMAIKVMVQTLESLRSENDRLDMVNQRLVNARRADAEHMALLEDQLKEYSKQLMAAQQLGIQLQEQLQQLRHSMTPVEE